MKKKSGGGVRNVGAKFFRIQLVCGIFIKSKKKLFLLVTKKSKSELFTNKVERCTALTRLERAVALYVLYVLRISFLQL